MDAETPPPPATARPSASVILARSGQDGNQVLLLRRHDRSSAFPSVHVFPGGMVRDDDRQPMPASWPTSSDLRDRISERSGELISPDDAAAWYVCAVRELFEESGVLLAVPGHAAAPAAEVLSQARGDLQRGAVSLAELLTRWDLKPGFDQLVPFSHWVTPDTRLARFDVWFFLAALPQGQEAVHCDVETTAGLWIAPATALTSAAAGAFRLVFPTRMQLQRLAGHETVDDLLAFARAKPIRRVQPAIGAGRDEPDEPPPGQVADW